MKHNIKILLDGSKYDGYEYYDVDDNAVKAVRHLMEDAGYLPMESKFWDIRCLPLPSYDNWKINTKPVRKWMTEEEGLQVFGWGVLIWGFYNDEVVLCNRNALSDYYLLLENGSWNYNIEHQPSHVMFRIEGEEPPKPPVIEKSLYEKVKEIYNNYSMTWQESEYKILSISPDLWNKACEKFERIHRFSNFLENETSQLICLYAVDISRDCKNRIKS